jgi:hypothetical protein
MIDRDLLLLVSDVNVSTRYSSTVLALLKLQLGAHIWMKHRCASICFPSGRGIYKVDPNLFTIKNGKQSYGIINKLNQALQRSTPVPLSKSNLLQFLSDGTGNESVISAVVNYKSTFDLDIDDQTKRILFKQFVELPLLEMVKAVKLSKVERSEGKSESTSVATIFIQDLRTECLFSQPLHFYIGEAE